MAETRPASAETQPPPPAPVAEVKPAAAVESKPTPTPPIAEVPPAVETHPPTTATQIVSPPPPAAEIVSPQTGDKPIEPIPVSPDPLQGLGVRQPSAALVALEVEERQRVGAVQDASAPQQVQRLDARPRLEVEAPHEARPLTPSLSGSDGEIVAARPGEGTPEAEARTPSQEESLPAPAAAAPEPSPEPKAGNRVTSNRLNAVIQRIFGAATEPAAKPAGAASAVESSATDASTPVQTAMAEPPPPFLSGPRLLAAGLLLLAVAAMLLYFIVRRPHVSAGQGSLITQSLDQEPAKPENKPSPPPADKS